MSSEEVTQPLQRLRKLQKHVYLKSDDVRTKVRIEDYTRLHDAQKGLCAICGNAETSSNRFGLKTLSVDHDHASGWVRGLLCNDCNLGLGRFHDDVSLLKKAIEYLETAQHKQIEILGAGDRANPVADGGRLPHRLRTLSIPQIKLLRERAQISIPQLDKISGVSYRMIYRAEDGEFVSMDAMQRVLDILNNRLGTNYTLDEVSSLSDMPTLFSIVEG